MNEWLNAASMAFPGSHDGLLTPLHVQIINAGQAKPSPPVGPALGQVRGGLV